MFFTVSPALPQGSPLFQVVNLTILADDADFAGVFDQVVVWRSRGAEGGPYEELTANMWRGARLPLTGLDQPSVFVAPAAVNVVGKVLKFLVNEKDTISITFTGVKPLTQAQAAAQIATQSLGRLRSWVDTNVKLVVETAEPGTGATLRVIASDAASFLGLPTTAPDDLSFGKEARLTLTGGTGRYLFSDKAGSSNYFYRTRFRNRFNNTASEFSPVYGASEQISVDPANIVAGYLDLVGLDGKSLVGIEVSLRAPFIGQLVAGKLVAGQDLMKKTDADGHVEFTLMLGQKYVLAISGTNIAKEIEAPTDTNVTSFLLVDDDFSTQDDYFRARVPQLPTMERRSL